MKSTGLWEVYSGLVLLSALLFRPHNLPVLVFCLLIQTMMTKYIWRPLKFDAAQITIMHYWFGQAFFYFQVSWMLSLLWGREGKYFSKEMFMECEVATKSWSGRVHWVLRIIMFLTMFLLNVSVSESGKSMCLIRWYPQSRVAQFSGILAMYSVGLWSVCRLPSYYCGGCKLKYMSWVD